MHKPNILRRLLSMMIVFTMAVQLMVGIIPEASAADEANLVKSTRMVNDDDDAIDYQGEGWTPMEDHDGVLYQSDFHTFRNATANPAPSVSYTFTGCGIEFMTSCVYSHEATTWGVDFTVTITDQNTGTNIVDGQHASMKEDTYGSGWGGVAYRKTDLPESTYTITITFDMTTGSQADVDAFRVHYMEEAPELSEQLQYLTDWYTSMDPSKGYIDLFEDEISYLTLDQNCVGVADNAWPAFKDMQSSHSWEVHSPVAQTYDITINCFGKTGAKLKVEVGENSLEYVIPYNGANRYEIGSIDIPEGESTLTLSLEEGNGAEISLNRLDLLPENGRVRYQELLEEMRQRPNWMKDNPIGAFFQYGEWGQASDGTHAEWPGCYATMDWDAFVKRLADCGVDYLVWSVTWSQYYVAAPIKAVDDVLPGRTTEHDYLRDILDACDQYGLRTIFYYHAGWDQGMGHTPAKDWWDAMYRNDLPNGNQARKELFMDRWMNIIREIGERYGTQLDGWMFDYTNSYNIGPFEKMLEISRAGNEDRIVTFNSSMNGTPAYTSLMDYYMGEAMSTNPGAGATFGEVPVRLTDGRYDNGPYSGMQSHFCFVTENEGSWWGWGIDRFYGAKPITPKFSQDHYNDTVLRAIKNKQAMSFCFQMFEDGVVCAESYERLKTAVETVKECLKLHEDTDDTITYTGDWSERTSTLDSGGGRHEAAGVDAACTFTFTGDSVTWFATTGPDYGTCDVYIDGVKAATVDLSSDDVQHQVLVFESGSLSAGQHTFKLVNQSEKKLSLDYLATTCEPAKPPLTAGKHNDDAATYDSSWSTNSHNSFYQQDYHDTAENSVGDTLTVEFYGTGIELIGCKGPTEGTAEIVVDDQAPVTVDCNGTDYTFDESIFCVTDLPAGRHTLKLTKTSGQYFKIDAFEVFGDPVVMQKISVADVPNGKLTPSFSFAVAGETVEITATPSVGYHFDAESLQVYQTGAPATTVAVTGNTFVMPDYPVTISGEFVKDEAAPSVTTYQIQVMQAEGGKISPASARVTRGSSKTFTISPDEGYAIADVLVDGESVGAVEKYTFKNVKAKHTITAKFEKVGETAKPVAGFTDVHENDWFAEAVKYVAEKGLMNGTSETAFSPKGATTRGMIVTILYRQAGSPAVESDGATWWSDARVWAMANGISDGTNMEKPITREQLATMLYRYAELTGKDVSKTVSLEGFPDAAKVSAYALEALAWAAGEGIVTGKTGGIMDPQAGATRAETSAMLMRFCESK